MFWGALLGIVVTMFLALIRGVKGPTVFDRILAVNNFGTNTVLLIAVAGFMLGIHDPSGSELEPSRPQKCETRSQPAPKVCNPNHQGPKSVKPNRAGAEPAPKV